MGEAAETLVPYNTTQELRLLCQHALALAGFDTYGDRPELLPPIEESLRSAACTEDSAIHSNPTTTFASPPSTFKDRSGSNNAAKHSSPPRILPKRDNGLSLGAQVLPPAHQWPGEPFALEPLGATSVEAWSDLQNLLRKANIAEGLTPPSDEMARRVCNQWREQAHCADILLIGRKDASAPLHQRLVEAIASRICSAVWVDIDLIADPEVAEPIFLHPAIRLLLITPEACASAPWLELLLREEPSGSVWHGRPAILLNWANDLAEDPAKKKILWEGLQAWKRGL